jgi:hypothetical protein
MIGDSQTELDIFVEPLVPKIAHDWTSATIILIISPLNSTRENQ